MAVAAAALQQSRERLKEDEEEEEGGEGRGGGGGGKGRDLVVVESLSGGRGKSTIIACYLTLHLTIRQRTHAITRLYTRTNPPQVCVWICVCTLTLKGPFPKLTKRIKTLTQT